MLTLSRKVGDSLRIGPDIRIIVRAVRGQQVQLSIEAPSDVALYREEVYEAIRRANLAAANQATPESPEDGHNSPQHRGKGGLVMKIETTRFGAIEVPEESIVEFPEGLLGLHEYRKYVLIDRPSSPLRWMQSMELPELAFLVADPQLFMNDYRAEVGASELSTIGEVDPRNLAVGMICTVPGDVTDATVNLKAPLVVDIASRRGKQVVLNDSPYSIHHPFTSSTAAAA